MLMIRFAVFSAVLALLLTVAACGDEHGDPDHAHLHFVNAPPATLTAGTDFEVRWAVETEGELHHTEIRACMGQNSTCGLGGAESFDANFTPTPVDGEYAATVNLSVAGDWTIVVFAHVGETPHISETVYVTVQ
jgi:hypothetical protein